MPVSIFYRSPTCRVAYSGPLAVMCLSGATTVEDLDRFDECQDQLSRSFKKFGNVTVMNGGFLKVNPGVVDRAAQMAIKYNGITTDGVIVINGRGLMAVLARAAVAAFSMANRSGGTIKTFNNPLEGVQCANDSLTRLGIAALSPQDIEELVNFIVSPA